MSNDLEIAKKIKSLKIGKSFTVKTESERQQASQAGKNLRRAGVIDFVIITRTDDDGSFRISAVEA